jgi:hypothetical protein
MSVTGCSIECETGGVGDAVVRLATPTGREVKVANLSSAGDGAGLPFAGDVAEDRLLP